MSVKSNRAFSSVTSSSKSYISAAFSSFLPGGEYWTPSFSASIAQGGEYRFCKIESA